MHCDFAFYIGGTHENAKDLAELESCRAAAGIKVFMGSSTGSLLVEDDEGVARHPQRHPAPRRLPRRRRIPAARAQGLPDRGRSALASGLARRDRGLIGTQRLVRLARETGKRVHVLHITTAQEMEFLKDHKDVASVETTPHHLTLEAPDCYERLGTCAQMNPPVRDAAHKAAIWRGVAQGVVDVLGSDHAPHTPRKRRGPIRQVPPE